MYIICVTAVTRFMRVIFSCEIVTTVSVTWNITVNGGASLWVFFCFFCTNIVDFGWYEKKIALLSLLHHVIWHVFVLFFLYLFIFALIPHPPSRYCLASKTYVYFVNIKIVLCHPPCILYQTFLFCRCPTVCVP